MDLLRGRDVRTGGEVSAPNTGTRAPNTGTVLLLGRAWCPTCRYYLTIVQHPDATDLTCPVCDTLTEPWRGQLIGEAPEGG